MIKKASQILLIIDEVFFIIIISFLLYLSYPIKTTEIVKIPNGSVSKIILYLNRKNFDVGNADKYLIYFFGSPQFGWIDMKRTVMSKGDFLYKLTHSKAPLIKITLVPGETKEIFFKEIAKNYDLSYEKLLLFYEKSAPYPDGVIIPESYKLPLGINEEKLIRYLINFSLKKHKEMALKYLKRYDQKEWFTKYVTIASIIQKEAADKEEMPLVSAVIYNRLKIGMKLQMDGALNYGKYSHIKVTKKRIREDSSPFNTYKYEGLPPYPVCSVSEEAVKAAVFPAKKNYLYFVKSKDNKHLFTDSYKKHLRNIKNGK